MKTLESMGIAAKSAASILAGATAKQKNDLLITAANDLIDATAELIRANEIDIENGRAAGLTDALLDRLRRPMHALTIWQRVF